MIQFLPYAIAALGGYLLSSQTQRFDDGGGVRGRKYKLGDKYSDDFDYDGMLKMGLKADISWGEKKLRKLYDSFEDVNYHIVAKNLWLAIQSLAQNPQRWRNQDAEMYLDKFQDDVIDVLAEEEEEDLKISIFSDEEVNSARINFKQEWKEYTQDARKDALVKGGYSEGVAVDLSQEDWDSLVPIVHDTFKYALLSEEVDRMKGMMKSLFTYGGLNKGSEYLRKYENKLGKPLFDKVYDEELNELQGYEVDSKEYTDAEGLTYKSLKKKDAI